MNPTEYLRDLLLQLGISPSYKGFDYVICAVSMCLQDRERFLLVTKWLYPDIAREYGTSWRNVERDIRTVSRLAWVRNRSLLENAAKRDLPEYPCSTQFLAILYMSLLDKENSSKY